MQLSAEFVNNLVAVLNVLASQVATALDTLNFALMTERGRPTDTVVTPRAPRISRHGLRPRIITEHPSSDRSRSPARIRGRPLDTSSTWYIPALSPPRATHRDASDHNPGARPESMLDRYHLLAPLLLSRHTVDESQDKRRLRHLIRILMVRYVRIQVHRRSGRRRRWSMVLENDLRLVQQSCRPVLLL